VLRILIVDDQPSFLAYNARAFKRCGHTVYLATTTSAALSHAALTTIDLAFVDLRIGSEWGIAAIESLKSIQPAMRIVMVSAYAGIASTAAAMRAGAEDVLPKPMKPSELLQRFADSPDEVTMVDTPPTLDHATFEHMLRVLTDCKGNLSEAARRLGIHRQSLQRWMRTRSGLWEVP